MYPIKTSVGKGWLQLNETFVNIAFHVDVLLWIETCCSYKQLGGQQLMFQVRTMVLEYGQSFKFNWYYKIIFSVVMF